MKFDHNIVQKVVEHLKNGEVVIVPTDTVYGIIADSSNEDAIAKIYKIKKRPINKQLIHLVSDIYMAETIALIPDNIKQILVKEWQIWKRPLTAILNNKDQTGTIAIRKPQNDFLIQIIKFLKKPIVAPSANISHEETGTTYEQVSEIFKDVVNLIIDGGNLINKPSKIIDFTEFPFRVLRE